MKKPNLIDELLCRYNQLADLKENISDAVHLAIRTYENGGKLLICGNGGSSADSDHIVGELMKSFQRERPLDQKLKTILIHTAGERGSFLSEILQFGLPAISLPSNSALTTAISNDIDANLIFAQQVMGYGKPGDILIGISTSGNSQNVIDALIVAKAKGLFTLGFSGETGGKMKAFCDVLINVPETRTDFVQELHLPIFHVFCRMLEEYFFNAD